MLDGKSVKGALPLGCRHSVSTMEKVAQQGRSKNMKRGGSKTIDLGEVFPDYDERVGIEGSKEGETKTCNSGVCPRKFTGEGGKGLAGKKWWRTHKRKYPATLHVVGANRRTDEKFGDRKGFASSFTGDACCTTY